MEEEIQKKDPNKSPENIYVPAIASVLSIAFGIYRYYDAIKPSDTYYPGFYKVFWFERPFINAFDAFGIIVFWGALGVLLAIIAGIFYYRIKIKPNRSN